ncbi:hypothetical protein JX266_012779 [Neoarthrinium moseri]|uniref:uncharacterized protein n=1 Tax=Neoarthrinium moseri TaxID=1658444 RepID=UPI001FDC24E7|nr:uncharacterized protein JN550_009741 [Neoarthrinium moseri]KAI1840998.1 hypothetical protein JX266_012779 [Neoarthrinium moseri]KAI1863215.1 hypothetical protein JN550_009741 [Neoarthrinium moseri]
MSHIEQYLVGNLLPRDASGRYNLILQIAKSPEGIADVVDAMHDVEPPLQLTLPPVEDDSVGDDTPKFVKTLNFIKNNLPRDNNDEFLLKILVQCMRANVQHYVILFGSQANCWIKDGTCKHCETLIAFVDRDRCSCLRHRGHKLYGFRDRMPPRTEHAVHQQRELRNEEEAQAARVQVLLDEFPPEDDGEPEFIWSCCHAGERYTRCVFLPHVAKSRWELCSDRQMEGHFRSLEMK